MSEPHQEHRKASVEISGIAQEQGVERLRLICEPTGDYQNKLLRTARRQGHLTCLVNAESVYKFRVVETNDTGKTDTKDPKVIATLGRLNKVIRHRVLNEDYLVLRKLGRIYDELESEITSLRCRIDRLLIELFCDFSFTKDFLYGTSGNVLIDRFGCNPYRIIDTGYEAFAATMQAGDSPYTARDAPKAMAGCGKLGSE